MEASSDEEAAKGTHELINTTKQIRCEAGGAENLRGSPLILKLLDGRLFKTIVLACMNPGGKPIAVGLATECRISAWALIPLTTISTSISELRHNGDIESG